ncbi:hypothetical protein [Delftia tsuruhatensis]|uniref:hypothetical protein n=1 Tax=Delftia tsuruhatensis TaxID=180282 RepID=UPI001F47A9C2|nr:hypothetical protein [Delftia tsuruhatensis]
MKKKFHVAEFSSSEYAACAMMGIALAAGFALVGKYIDIPRLLYILAWLVAFAFLAVAVTRIVHGILVNGNLPMLAFASLMVVGIYASASKPTGTGFIRHDEIYSWGMWGVQHFLKQPYDTYYTQAPYPQFFSYELASVFLTQGNHVSHFAAKLICGIPALVVLIAFSDLVAASSSRFINWLSLLLVFWALASFSNLLFWAYADPLATALILLSFTLLLQYSKKPGNLRPLLLSLFCGFLASLTKQPGLVWCLVTLPVLTAYGVWRWKWRPVALAACSVMMLLAAIWPFFVAPNFTGNQGVLDIAEKNGGFLASILLSIKKYIIDAPEIGLLLLGTMLISSISSKGRMLWVLCVLPFLVIWFAAGSYEQRHGIHVLFVSTALAIHFLTEKYPCVDDPKSDSGNFNLAGRFSMNLIAVAISATLLTSSVYLAFQRNFPSLQDGNRAIFISQFGNDAIDVYDDIIDKQRRIFLVSNYQYGMFFNRTIIGRPDQHKNSQTTEDFLKELAQFKPDYIFDAGEWTYGPYAPLLHKLLEVCPAAFVLKQKNTFFPYSAIYKVDSQVLSAECLSRIGSAPV